MVVVVVAVVACIAVSPTANLERRHLSSHVQFSSIPPECGLDVDCSKLLCQLNGWFR